LAVTGELAPLLEARFVSLACGAVERGACILASSQLASKVSAAAGLWIHDNAGFAFAAILESAIVPSLQPIVGAHCVIASSAVLGPRVELGARVHVGPGAVIGHPGFGWVAEAAGGFRAIPQLGGVVIEDDVSIGPLCTIDAGTLAPTRIRRGAKLDSHVHIGHNCDVGANTIIAAQCGIAGSVTIGESVLMGGQAGIADHVTVGSRARIAAKSGVIADVPPGTTVAGYPAVGRVRWLRGLANLYRNIGTGK